MILSPMRFCSYTWLHNPKEIKVRCENSQNEIKIPEGKSVLQSFGRKNRVIEGTGEIYGEDCFYVFGKIWELYESGERGILSLPGFGCMYARFSSLVCTGKGRDYVTYTFSFREDMSEKRGKSLADYTPASGETLWDISYRFNIPVETLLLNNPQIPAPDISLDCEVKLI